jgi:SAM-dependent methyltransferase
VDDAQPTNRRVVVGPDAYDRRWRELAATGADVHGEANLVAELLGPELAQRDPVLDAGCGTGRVAIELSRRGYRTVGLDVDAHLLDHARDKAPGLEWHEGDLATLAADVAPGPFAGAVLAGNVMIFVARGSHDAVLRNLATRLATDGLLIAGFQLGRGLSLDEFDAAASAAGLSAVTRFATWDRAPYLAGGDYVVTVDSKR